MSERSNSEPFLYGTTKWFGLRNGPDFGVQISGPHCLCATPKIELFFQVEEADTDPGAPELAREHEEVHKELGARNVTEDFPDKVSDAEEIQEVFISLFAC